MKPADLQAVRAFEQLAFNAWPASETVACGGWIFRVSGGYTKRANSANAVEPGALLGGVRETAETLYAGRGLPAVFRLSPLAAPEADRELEKAGYRFFDPSFVARASLDEAATHRSVTVASQASPGWLHGFATANGVAPALHEVHHAIVRSIALPTGFATVHQDGQPIGFGLAVREHDWVGFYDIVIDASHRQQGHGGTMMRALLDWGRRQGARSAYLQVREQNEPARRMYAAMGFEDIYRYHYRVPPGRGQDAGPCAAYSAG